MREESGQVQGGQIDSELMLRGQIIGSAIVKSGGHLLLLGQVTEDLVIEKGGSAEVLGMVCGDVVNDGRLELSGTVIGALRDRSGNSVIDAGARIAERSQSED